MEECVNQSHNCPSGKNYYESDESRGDLASGGFGIGLVSSGKNPADSADDQNKEEDDSRNHNRKPDHGRDNSRNGQTPQSAKVLVRRGWLKVNILSQQI